MPETQTEFEKISGALKDLRGDIDTMSKSVVVPHRDGKGFNQWLGEDDDESLASRQKRYERGTGPYPIVPPDYKPYQQWKGVGTNARTGRPIGSLSQFLHDGLRLEKSQFRDKYISAAKPVAESLEKSGILKAGVQGMSELIGADGGFAVLPEYSTTIFEKVYENDLFNRTDNYTCVGNNMTFPRLNETSRATGSRAGGLQAYWLGEGAALTKSKPALGQLGLKLKKLAVLIYLTDELIDDAGIALEQYVTRKVTQEFNFMFGDAIVEGTGAGQPQGIMNSGALYSVGIETGQATKTVVKENLDKMYSRMWAGSIPNSVWLINQDVWPSIFSLNQSVGTGGYPMFIEPGKYSSAPNGVLLGRPVLPVEFCQTVGTTGDIIFADLAQYITLSKGGVAQAQSIHVEFLTDQLALRFIMRVDGATWENSPVTPFHGSNNQSSFIALSSR